jgi:probable HAF family extracellular repeat protein
MSWIRKLELVTVVVAACLLCNSVTQAKRPPAQAAYTIIPFMPPDANSVKSGVSDLNEVGHVVGFVTKPDGATCGLHLDLNTGDYTLLNGGTNSSAADVNNLNQIVGRDGDLAAFWSGPSTDPIPLLPLFGDVRSAAGAINDAGMVIGASYDAEGSFRSVIWRVTIGADEVPQVSDPWLLEPPGDGIEWEIYDVNELIDGTAQAVGSSYDDGELRAVIWTVSLNDDETLTIGTPVSLGTLGLDDPSWSLGTGINDFGDVCGRSDDYPCFSLGGDLLQPLAVPRDMYQGHPLAINNLGEIVGWVWFYGKRQLIVFGNYRAYLWRNGKAIDLNNEISGESGWDNLDWANCVNDAGVIGGFGRFDVQHRGFLLIPNNP